MLFSELPLRLKTLQGIEAMGYTDALPIQERAIPAGLEGRDIIGCAQTGMGKTAAFLIPMIDGMQDMRRPVRFRPRGLVILPTRELARQVAEHFDVLAGPAKLKSARLYGGVDIGDQDLQLNAGVDLVVATPGRLLDHLNRGGLKLKDLAYLVIDEADRLFDEGFLPDLRKIIDYLPERRQTMLFSATMPPEMEDFAHAILREPERIQIGKIAPKDNIVETFWPAPDHQKLELLARILREEKRIEKLLVFVRTKSKTFDFAAPLGAATGLKAAPLSSDLPQEEREKIFDDFRRGDIQLVVATDVAARGLDIEGISHVVNFDVPSTPDTYIHRIGRTGRVDRAGVAITLVAPHELTLAASIEASIRRTIPMRRLPGFEYDMDSPEALAGSGDIYIPRKESDARPFTDRPLTNKPKENPFTKSGSLKRKHQDKDLDKPKRGAKKRTQKRIMTKKLRHQKRK